MTGAEEQKTHGVSMIFTLREHAASSHTQCGPPYSLAAALDLPPYMDRLLKNRGIVSIEQARTYLAPRLSDLPGPEQFKAMDRAVDLILHAIEQDQEILVYGDYDVDGVCGTALLVDFFSQLGARVSWVIPDRHAHGYGLSCSLLEERRPTLAGSRPLLVTVDNGISAREEIKRARELGFRVLLTDHHEPGLLPEADCLLNPRVPDSGFPFPDLAGVGVAFYLAWGLRRTMMATGLWRSNQEVNLKRFLDLVALGTVADVMPLVGVNRILVRAGLETMAEQPRPGLLALCQMARVDHARVNSEDIAFRLGPRLNACGRVDRADQAVKLLLSDSMTEAATLAAAIEQCNVKRQHLMGTMMDKAMLQAMNLIESGSAVPVLMDETYHPGVVGIVAAKLCETLARPILILGPDRSDPVMVKGSGRSIDGIDLYQLISECRGVLEKFGGHPRAVGVTVRRDQVDRLQEIIDQAGSSIIDNEQIYKKKKCIVDLELDHLPDGDSAGSQPRLNPELLQTLSMMQPFGEANPEPVFLSRGVRLRDLGLTRKQFLRFSVRIGGDQIQGIGFTQGKKWLEVAHAGRVDLAFTVKPSFRNPRGQVQVQAVAIEPTY